MQGATWGEVRGERSEVSTLKGQRTGPVRLGPREGWTWWALQSVRGQYRSELKQQLVEGALGDGDIGHGFCPKDVL